MPETPDTFVWLTWSCIRYIILSILVHLVFRFSLRDLECNLQALERLAATMVLEQCVGVVAGVCMCLMDSTSPLSRFQHIWNVSASAFKCSHCLSLEWLHPASHYNFVFTPAILGVFSAALCTAGSRELKGSLGFDESSNLGTSPCKSLVFSVWYSSNLHDLLPLHSLLLVPL